MPAEFVRDARQRLQEQRAFRIAQLNRLDAAADATVGATSDAARDEIDATLREAAQLVLALIDAALCRIDQGSYGHCQRCGDEMSLERLAALPMSTWCGSCQHTEEIAGVKPGRGPEQAAANAP